MGDIKIISIFKTNKIIPFITCIANEMEENEVRIKLAGKW